MAKSQRQEERHPLAYRILHETILASILLLIVTGFYIHRPFVDGGGFLMSLSQGVHIFAAFVLVIAAVIRVLGMFIGPHRDWRSFIPGGSDLKLLPKQMSYYAYLTEAPEIEKKYNPLQMLTYSFVFLLVIFQIISGFALMYPEGWLSWFNYGLFNNEIEVRIAHYVVNWIFVLFLIIHVYMNIRENAVEMKSVHLMRPEEQ